MKLIRPTPITDAELVSSTIPETDYGVWESTTTYTLGARTIKSHRQWESAQAGNLNHDPDSAGLSWWIDLGPTNRMAMFDDKVGTQTVADLSLTVVLAPGRIDALALLQVAAALATVTMTIGAEVVYEREVSLIDDSGITDWYAYFFEPIRPKDYVVLTDLPVYGEAITTITLSKPAGEVSCGMAIVGQKSDLGGTLTNPSAGINDYSKKSTDDFGNTTLVPRSFSKRMGVKLILDNTEIDRVHAVLASLRAAPVIWIGDEEYSSLLVYGFYRDFELDIAYANFSYCSLNIEGMI